MTCTATYVVTQADVTAGKVTNAATATGTGPDKRAIVSVQSVAVLAGPPPRLAITGTDDLRQAQVGLLLAGTELLLLTARRRRA